MDLKKILREKLKTAAHVAILGVGSELRADDAAGLLVARAILKKIKNKKNGRIKVFIGETAPENLTGEIKKYRPDFVIIIDAADTGKPAGTVLVLEPNELKGHSFCTHQLPMTILADYLTQAINCKILVVGIQPKILTFGTPPSSEVKRSAALVATVLAETIGS